MNNGDKNNTGTETDKSGGSGEVKPAVKAKNMDDKSKLRRLLLIGGGAVAALCLLLLLNNIDFDAITAALFAPKTTVSDKKINFATPDYEENIFENSAYLGQNLYVRYTDGALSTLIADGNFAVYGEPVALLKDYLDAVIYGDAEQLPDFFTADYIKNNELPSRFTTQKLYDIEIELYSKNVLDEGTANQITRWEYTVRYKIMENNGTFRSDVGSDAAVPEIYEILSYDMQDKVLINSITKIYRVTE